MPSCAGILESLGGRIGATLDPSKVILRQPGSGRATCGAYSDHLLYTLDHLGSSWGILAHPGVMLGSSWGALAVPGLCLAHLLLSW